MAQKIPKTKKCCDCGKRKPIKKFTSRTYFAKKFNETRVSFSRRCFDCLFARQKKSFEEKTDKPTEKKCSTCGETKPIDHFYQYEKNMVYDSYCKLCKIIKDRERKSPQRNKKYYLSKKKKNLKKKPPEITEKECSRCKGTFPISNFHYNRNGGRYQSYCKTCQVEYRRERYSNTDYDKKYYKENEKEIKKRTKDWYDKNKEHQKELQNEYILNYPERYTATAAVRTAVLNGSLKVPDKCECCEKERRTEAHHMDYSRHLDVLWLCRSCHRTYHNGNKTDIVESIKKLWEEKYGN